MKIIHLLVTNKFSGAENVACQIIDVNKNEKDTDVYYCSLPGEIEQVLKEKNIKFIPLDKLNINNINKIIEKYNPDVIHAHDYKASVLVAISKFKGKIISHLHNNSPEVKTWGVKSIIYSLLIKRFDKVVGVSQKVYDEAVFKNKMKNKFIKVYNYVNKDKILELSKEEKYKNKYDLFYIGRLVEAKDPLKFIDIVSKLKIKYPNIKAVMIGDGQLYQECIAKIKENDLVNNIELVGFRSNPFPIIKNCKIGIMPSIYEGFGLTAIESMCLEKPVFNSGVGGLGEIFKDNDEYICSSIKEYTEKIDDLLKKEKIVNDVNIDEFIDEKRWRNQVISLYRN